VRPPSTGRKLMAAASQASPQRRHVTPLGSMQEVEIAATSRHALPERPVKQFVSQASAHAPQNVQLTFEKTTMG